MNKTNTTTQDRPETVTCELCGRSVDRNLAKTAPVVGYVGSTCYQSVSAVAEVLEQNGLGFLADGPVRVTREDLDARKIIIPGNFKRRAYELGLELDIERIDDDTFVITPTVRAGKRFRRALS
jgi:hypothetical protein